MNIAGIQKLTLLDYPGKVACTIFTQGCNFRCPFCHNGDILDAARPGDSDAGQIMEFLRSRRGLLDGVCITGGEPTVQPDLPEFLSAVRQLGYYVKLDTNGFRPDVLRKILDDGLVDYVAMDIKNSPSRYSLTTGVPQLDIQHIEDSIRLLASGNTPFELRTTVAQELHDEQSVEEMGRWVSAAAAPHRIENYFIQPFVDRDSVLTQGLHAPSSDTAARFVGLLAPYFGRVEVRGQ